MKTTINYSYSTLDGEQRENETLIVNEDGTVDEMEGTGTIQEWKDYIRKSMKGEPVRNLVIHRN